MPNLKKKIVAVVTALTLSVMMVPGIGQGQTVEELLAQIAALQKQLADLQAQLAALQPAAPTVGVPAACTGITFVRNLTVGSTGADVKCLQALLNTDPATQVAATGPGSPGKETSYFGPLTRIAVIKFQEKYAAEILTPVGLTKGTGFIGSKTIAKLNALLVVAPPVVAPPVVAPPVVAPPEVPPPPAPIFKPLTVKLAVDTPPAANVMRGTPNNVVLKITLTGAETGTTNITGLTVTNYGILEDIMIPSVKILDENNVQVGPEKKMIGGRATFIFVPALPIAEKGSRTLSVAVDIAIGAEILKTVQLGIDKAGDITGATFTETFPIKGNVFTVTPTGAIGSLTVSQTGAIPVTAVKIGQKDVVLNRFTVSVGAREDVKISQIIVRNNATTNPISDTDITNIRVREAGGAVVAGPVNLINKVATFIVSPAISLTKGTTKNFEIIADIYSGKERRVKLDIEVGKVIGVGVTTGVAIVSTGSSTAAEVIIGVGTLTVTQSTKHPTGTAATFVKTTASKILAVFSVRAIGEDVVINLVRLKFDGTNPDINSTNYLTSVGLYEGEALISDLKDSITDENPKDFSLNWVIPAGTTKELTVKAVTANYNPPDSGNIVVTWKGLSGTDYNGYGLASGELIRYTSDVPVSRVTVYPAGTYTVAVDDVKTPYNQGVLQPTTDVVLAAIKVRPVRENMELKSLKITTTVADDKLSALTLYDEAGTPLSLPVTPTEVAGASDYFLFDVGNLLTKVVFPKDTFKSLIFKGNTKAAQDGYYLTIKDETGCMVLTGVESGADKDLAEILTADLALRTAVRGTFDFTDKIIEVKKNPASPVGSVTRATEAVHAIWDVTNVSGTTIQIDKIKFTSKTGLPTALVDTEDNIMFRLYDENGTRIGGDANTTLVKAAGTVEFGTATSPLNLDILPGTSKTFYLKINTTNTAKWAAGTEMLWTIAAAGDVTFDATLTGKVGWGGTTWSIPADTNLTRVP